jgi:peptidylprolyl isomerase
MTDRAKNGDVVRVHYTGRLESGEVFDSSEGGEPLEFEVGAEQVITGFDEAVRGMQVGDKKTTHIAADDAYGPRNDALIQTITREGMNMDVEPQVGMNLMMKIDEQNQIPLTITEVTDTHVTLDANHPLAGQNLTFDIERV